MRRLVVLGAGAIGAGIGGMLAEAGLPVVWIARGAHGEALRDRGLSLRTPDRVLSLQQPVHPHPSTVDWTPGDVCLVATKLNDAEAAYDDLLAAAGPDVPVIAAQNGPIGDVWAAERFETVWPTMVWIPAEHLSPGDVRLHGVPVPGALDVGPEATEFSEWLVRAGFRSTVRDDLDRWKNAKWVTNLCGAAIVFGHSAWIEELLAEGRRVLEAAGRDTASRAELEAYVGDITLRAIDGAERLPGGSTAQAHHRGRPLEVPWLNGPMVELGRSVGVATPFNERVMALG